MIRAFFAVHCVRAAIGMAVLTAAQIYASENHARGSDPNLEPVSSGPGWTSTQFANSAKPSATYGVTCYELEKRWDGVNKQWSYSYRSAGSFENQDINRVRRHGEGWVEGDRRWITVNGVRKPYRYYVGPYSVGR